MTTCSSTPTELHAPRGTVINPHSETIIADAMIELSRQARSPPRRYMIWFSRVCVCVCRQRSIGARFQAERVGFFNIDQDTTATSWCQPRSGSRSPTPSSARRRCRTLVNSDCVCVCLCVAK